jgi:hypothetical protein
VPGSTAAPTVAVERTTNVAGANWNQPRRAAVALRSKPSYNCPIYVFLCLQVKTSSQDFTDWRINLYRSLRVLCPPDDSFLKILELLAEEGYLQANRRFECYFRLAHFLDCSPRSRFVELICSMTNLQSLDIVGHELTTDVLARVVQSCSQLTSIGIHYTGTFIATSQ